LNKVTNEFRGIFSDLSRYGFSVFPLPRGQKSPSAPWTRFQTELPSSDQILAWDASDLNVGVVCGRLSNLLVLDVDGNEAQEFVDSLGLPPTPVVTTGRGRHYYFRYPMLGAKNRAKIEGLPLDCRGDGGYVVGPGSIHPSGSVYQWEVGPEDCEFATLPDNVASRLFSPRRSVESRKSVVLSNGKSRAAGQIDAGLFSDFLEFEIGKALEELRSQSEGGRNDTLNRVAYRLAGHASALSLPWESIVVPLNNAALEIGLEPGEIAATLQSAWEAGSQMPTPWIVHAQQWVYVAKPDCFVSKTNHEHVRPIAFSRYLNHVNPHAKGGFANSLLNAGLVEKALDVRFDPFNASGLFTVGDQTFLNSYRRPEIEAVEGDVSPFVNFLEYLVPDSVERDHLIKMIAWTVRNPGRKLAHALLLTSTTQGIGKTTLVELWRDQLGHSNTRKTTSDEMESQFQEYIGSAIMVFVEEVNFGQGFNSYNKVKDLITGETAVVNRKFVAASEQRNFMNFVLLSNMDAPIFIEPSDRRFFVVKSPATKRDGEFWSSFHLWLKESAGVIRWFLEDLDLSAFNPNEAPPMTQAKLDLIEASRDPLSQDLTTMIASRRWPFSRDVFSVGEVQQSLSHTHWSVKNSKLLAALRSVGCERLGQFRTHGEWLGNGGIQPVFIERADTRVSLWSCGNVDYWGAADPSEIVAEYERQHGAMVSFDNPPVSANELPLSCYPRGGLLSN
jgi:hypothetical protein